jgi:hypothetical protein
MSQTARGCEDPNRRPGRALPMLIGFLLEPDFNFGHAPAYIFQFAYTFS